MKHILYILCLAIAACSSGSASDLDRLCRQQLDLEKRIRAARQTGGNDQAAVADFAKVAEQLQRYPQEKVYQAMQRVSGGGR